MAGEIKKDSLLNVVKLWVFPSLVTVLSLMIWRDINEMRADVKALLAQSNIDKTKIDNLEKDVKFLQDAVYKNRIGSTDSTIVYKPKLLFSKLYFKHEEIYNVDKHLKKIRI